MNGLNLKGSVPSILFKIEFILNYSSSRHRDADDIAPLADALVGVDVDAPVFHLLMVKSCSLIVALDCFYTI